MANNCYAADILFIVLVLWSIILTMRRSGILSAILVIMSISMLRLIRKKTRKATKVVSLVIPLAILIFANFFINTQIGYEIAKRFEDLNFDTGTASGRYIFQRITVEHILRRGYIENIFGEGAGYIKDVIATEYGLNIGAHSDWLDIAASYGIIGLGLFSLFFVNLVRLFLICVRKREKVDTVLAIFLIIFFMSISSGGVLEVYFAMPYSLLGLVVADQISSLGEKRVR